MDSVSLVEDEGSQLWTHPLVHHSVTPAFNGPPGDETVCEIPDGGCLCRSNPIKTHFGGRISGAFI